MKKGILLVSSILAITLLGGCNESTSGSSSSSSTGDVPTDWTDAEKKLMSDNLEGNVIPFYYVAGQTVTDAYFEEYGCISVEAAAAVEADLTAYAAVLVDAGYTVSVAKGEDSEYPYFIEYLLADDIGNFIVQAYTGTLEEGTAASGKWTIDAYYNIPLTDYSAEYTTYADAKAGVVAYFDNYEATGLVLPEALVTSATSYKLSDYRYIYSESFGIDFGPYALLSLNGALATELEAVSNAFVAAGWEVAVSETTSSESSSSSDTSSSGSSTSESEEISLSKGNFVASISFYAADETYPASIDIYLNLAA